LIVAQLPPQLSDRAHDERRAEHGDGVLILATVSSLAKFTRDPAKRNKSPLRYRRHIQVRCENRATQDSRVWVLPSDQCFAFVFEIVAHRFALRHQRSLPLIKR